jgi:Poly(3-hydroxybutyrate) depolymerase
MDDNFLIFAMLAAASFLIACDNDDHPGAKPTRQYEEIDVDGRMRSYLINIQNAVDEGKTVPLVLMLHGTGGSASQAERDYGWNEKAKEENFIVVYPEGVPGEGRFRIRTWNAGTCCQYAMEQNVNDVKFINSLTEHLIRKYPVDPSRVYVVGMSNGAMLAYRLACELPEKFAAIGAVSGTMMLSEVCDGGQPTPFIHIHSVNDTKVPYNGGKGIGGYYFASADSAINVIGANNGCSKYTTTSDDAYTHSLIEDCSDDASIETWILNDGGHSWPGGRRSSVFSDEPSTAINATGKIWEFFRKHKR